MASDESKTVLLSADHPRSDPSQDLLGYAPFARMLAHSVLRGSPAAGLVVGIYGEWGLGKTTLLNFIEHFTTLDAGDDTPIIVRFNPWWFSGREDLLRRFFKEFEAAVLKRRSRNTRLRDALQRFGDAIGNLPVAWVAGVGKVVAAATKLGQPTDVLALKDAIVQALEAEALRVIVLIDDIDRLLPSEMTDLFRLVRSVGDFPNVHYVLAFDRQVVVKALKDECHTDGERYLDKIIQAPFVLPHPGAVTLQKLFTQRLDEVLSGTDSELFDATYWGDVFLHGIAPFLRTPRDVTRLINALAVVYPSVRNEVNPVDFVAIETLRVFAPEAYESIRSNRTRFVGMLLHLDHLRDENKRFHEHWIDTIERDRDTVHALVVRLFPTISSILAKTNAGPDREAILRKMRRLCTEPMFDVYFRYSLDRGLSRAAFLNLLERSPEELGPELRRLASERLDDGHTRFRWFLEMLRDELSAGKRFARKDLLQHLCALGDEVIAGTPRALTFEVPYDSLLRFAVEKLLEAWPAADRATALRAALQSAGVSTTAMLVMFLGAQHGRYGGQVLPEEERTIQAEADLDALEQLARERIERASTDGTLWSAARFPRLLFDWRRLGGDAQVRAAVGNWCADDQNLLKLVESLREPGERGHDRINTGALSALVDLDAAVGRAKKLIAESAVDARARGVLGALLESYSSTEAARREQETRARVLRGILAEVERTGWYPTMHWVRTTFEADRAVVDRLAQERFIRHVGQADYLIAIAGLQQVRSDPRAARDLRACAILIRVCLEEYRKNDKARVDLEQTAAQRRDEGVDANALGRAAMILLVDETPGMHVEWASGGAGRPTAVLVRDGIQKVSPETLLGVKA